jgi:hypothetical protein
MRSTNHHKYPARSYRNDYGFASFGDSSASVLSTRNAARFDGEFSATGQIGPAETILSGRAIAAARTGCMHGNHGSGTASCSVANGRMSDIASEPNFFYRATLFDSVMDFLDRYDQMAATKKSSQSAERSESSTT